MPATPFCLPPAVSVYHPLRHPRMRAHAVHMICADRCALHIGLSLALYTSAMSMTEAAVRTHGQGMYRESFMLLQASNAAGGADVLVSEILPQLLPLFTCTAAQRKLYGCSEPAAPDARAGASTSLPSGDSAGQSMHQRMRQALEHADHPVPGAPSPSRGSRDTSFNFY